MISNNQKLVVVMGREGSYVTYREHLLKIQTSPRLPQICCKNYSFSGDHSDILPQESLPRFPLKFLLKLLELAQSASGISFIQNIGNRLEKKVAHEIISKINILKRGHRVI